LYLLCLLTLEAQLLMALVEGFAQGKSVAFKRQQAVRLQS